MEQEAKLTAEEFERMVAEGMSPNYHFRFRVEEIRFGFVRLRSFFGQDQLRPGGSISGPVMFTVGDTALFALTASVLGPDPMVVTTDTNLRFLRRPAPADVIAEAHLLKLGRQLVVGEVRYFSDGSDKLVAQMTGAYARINP